MSQDYSSSGFSTVLVKKQKELQKSHLSALPSASCRMENRKESILRESLDYETNDRKIFMNAEEPLLHLEKDSSKLQKSTACYWNTAACLRHLLRSRSKEKLASKRKCRLATERSIELHHCVFIDNCSW